MLEEEGVAATPFLEHQQVVKWIECVPPSLSSSPVLFSLVVLPSLGPISGLIPSPGQTSQASQWKPHPRIPTDFPMPNREIACSPNKGTGWDKPAYTQGYFLIRSGPFENIHVCPSDEIFMAEENTLHSGFAFSLGGGR